MKRFPDPKRSAAAKKGWITRRKRQAEREAKQQRRRQAALKGWETRRAKSARELELESEVERLKRELAESQKRAKKLEAIAKARKEKIRRIERPVRIQQLVKKDPEAFRVSVGKEVERKILQDGFGVYQAIVETHAEIDFLDEYSDIDDVRQAFADEAVSPEVE